MHNYSSKERAVNYTGQNREQLDGKYSERVQLPSKAIQRRKVRGGDWRAIPTQ